MSTKKKSALKKPSAKKTAAEKPIAKKTTKLNSPTKTKATLKSTGESGSKKKAVTKKKVIRVSKQKSDPKVLPKRSSELAGVDEAKATSAAPPLEMLATKAVELVLGAHSSYVMPSGALLSSSMRVPEAEVFALSAAQMANRGMYRLGELRGTVTSATKGMDPRLQMAAARSRFGLTRAATASSAANEIPVVAKVSDVEAWEAISEVRVGATIGKLEDGNYVVTARVPVSRIEAVRKQAIVASLKAAQPVRPALASTLQETGARADLLPEGANPKGGKGVVVGVVDFGCDFAHLNFRKADGKTRLEAIWHQAAGSPTNSTFGYGRVFRTEEINAALLSPAPYASLGYGPDPDTFFEKGTHGTHVMDIAAGNGRGSGVQGCAPEASLIFVDLAANDVPWSGMEGVGKSFGDSVRLLEAIKFLFSEAGDRPCVVNLSLGTNGGPHDGTTLVEQGIDALLREKPNRAVVIAASNSFADGIHAGGDIPAGGTTDLTWVHERSFAPAELEIWIPGAAQAAIELIAPDGTSIGIVEPGDSRQFADGNQILVFIANRLGEPNNGDNSIGIFLAGAFEAGTWIARLHGRGAIVAPYHAWVERFDSAQSSFAPPHDNSHTLGSISCGYDTIVVGSYDAHKTALPISWFSSEGPTRDKREKPELSGPGHDVLAAWSRTGNRVVSKSGTSMAAPAVSGIIALIYAEAMRKGRDLSIADLRAILISEAKKTPPEGPAWDSRYGNGRITANALAAVLGLD